ncbi:sulfite oxidase heme-binding subunit YedZ [Plastorhodobacter daqingensis]|uniref:Sulfite oxidase heme-binding subunit YedZ n=1 Tax=Plastorhodobacter daqingensis TaxID=1387281 RepID=A0ABW2UJV0_9RHOB
MRSRMMRLMGWSATILGAVPGVVLWWRWQAGLLGVMPTEVLLHRTGQLALFFLMLSLLIGFVHFISGWNALFGARRPIGLWCFAYAMAHLGIWLVLDQGQVAFALAELRSMAHLQLGLLAFLALVPLALSSTDAALRRLTVPVWKRVHLLVWPAAALAVTHAWLVARFENPVVMAMAGVLAALALTRVLHHLSR